MSVHRFRPRLPKRAVAVAAVLDLVGAVLVMVLVFTTDRVVWAVPGLVLMLLGTVLFVLALLSHARNGAEVELTEVGYRVTNRQGEQTGRWADVASVKQSVAGDRLTFVGADASEVHVVAAQGGISSLSAEVTTMMNRSRGYGEL